MRKLLSVLLVLAMVLGFAGTAFAADPSVVAGAKFSDIAGNDAEGDITLLATKGVLKGDSGATTVRPDATITRAEFAAMVVRMLGKDSLATSLASMKPATKDEIPSWAWGYVNVVSSMGIMKGDPDGAFRPLDNVTFAEALAMLERAIGWDIKATGLWPTNYLMVAYELELNDGVDVFANTPATRGEVAIMMVNTMETQKLLGIKDDGTDNLGTSILGTNLVEGVVTAVAPDSNSITLAVVGSKTLAASVSLSGAAKFSDLVNVNVKMVLVSGKVVFITVADTANVITGTFKSIVAPTATDTNTYIKLSNGNKYPIKDANITGKLNKTDLANFAAIDAALVDDGTDAVVLNLVDSKVVYVEASRVNITNALAKAPVKVNTTDYTIVITKSIGGDTGALDVTTSTPVTIDGVAKTIADVKANDVVYVTTVGALDVATTDIIKLDAYRASVKGEVTAVKDASSGITVTLKLEDGTSKDYVLSIITAPNVGDTVQYRLNSAGKARFVVGFSATANIGYITDIYTTTTSTGDKFYVVLDQAGVSKTFQVGGVDTTPADGTPDAYAAIVGFDTDSFIEFTTDISGKLDTVAARTPTGVSTGKVYAIDATNGIVIIKDTVTNAYTTFGTDGLSVYQDNGDATFSNIGVAGLAKDDLVKYQAGEFDLLVRQDQ